MGIPTAPPRAHLIGTRLQTPGDIAMKSCALMSLAVLAAIVSSVTCSRGAEPERAANAKLTRADVEAMMKSCSNAGRWGDKDELGALNLITPVKRRQAAGLVSDGVSVSLARVLRTPTESAAPFRHKMLTLPQPADITSTSDEYCAAYHGFTLTHVDAL